MKFSTATLILLGISGQALAFGRHGAREIRNGEAIAQVARRAENQPFNTPGRPFGPFALRGPPFPAGPGKAVTKVEPIVAIYNDAGTVTTQTGVVIEIGPTRGSHGRVITKTIWPGPRATEAWRWDAGVHTKTLTIVGPAPTNPHDPWSDWFGPPHSITGTISRETSTSSTYPTSTSDSAGFPATSNPSGSSGIGPVGRPTSSTSSVLTSSSNTISSSSSASLQSTFTTSFTSSSTSSSAPSTSVSTASSSRIPDNPNGSTTSISSSSIDSSPSSTSFSSSTTSATSSTASTSSPTSDSSPSSSISSTGTSSTSTTTSSTTSSGPSAVVTSDVSSLSYIDSILQAHNIHRSNHTAQNLTWSVNLASIAAGTAASCYYDHNTTAGGGGYGQNIGAGYTPQHVPAMVGNDMYNSEMPYYPLPYGQDNADTTQFDRWGHFSQIVWKDTKEVGCATQQCTKLENADGVAPYFTVCNYSPPGNIQGAYSQVGAPLGQPTVVIVPS